MSALDELRPATRLVHAGQPDCSNGTAPVNIPVVRTSTVRFRDCEEMDAIHHRRDGGETISAYGRHGTETHRALEEALCTLEGGHRALLCPSGLGAISLSFLALTHSGAHVLASDNVYQPIKRIDAALLRKMGVEVSFFSASKDRVQDHLRPNTTLIYSESPGSSLYEMADLQVLGAEAARRGIALVVDNTWASGYLFNPLASGATVSILANTKYISGHSDLMQGAVVLGDPALAKTFDAAYDAMGFCVGADDAYLALRGLRTLGVRMERHGDNALKVAEHLRRLPRVRRVYCPALPDHPGHELWKRDFRGTNGLISVEFDDFEWARITAVADHLSLFSIGASWGGYESLALPTHGDKLASQSSWSGAAGVLRLHIGLEDPQDLIDDLVRAIDLAANLPIPIGAAIS
ncbi:trans-sulfuration enzyme family protein [Bordetella flabilis]|uniref:Cystathionine beta-lyase n=1 Tax=Bordetella flabilis TaxID=463014 RepID=A0A193GDZ6_9BORD|nr:PLP-dependent aspartate aminotransferase family protein [Bordetella flabilis]ANN77838.1 cystathionine beta-lyase [Bordetella flabilis]